MGTPGDPRPRGRSPIRLARSVTFPTYQLRAALHAPALPPDRQMEAAVRVVLQWVAEKLPIEVAGIEEMANPFRLEVDAGTFVETVWRAEARVWALRLVHPDTGDVRAPVAGRAFTTHVTLLERGGAVEALVQTLCTQPPSAPRDVDVVRPALVGRLCAEPGLRDVLPIDGRPVLYAKEADLVDLRALLRNPHRSLPVVVVRRAPRAAEPPPSAMDADAAPPGPAAPAEAPAAEPAPAPSVLAVREDLDAVFLAEKLLGYAAVAVLEGGAADALPAKVPAEYGVDVGGVRVYQPGLEDWKTDAPQRHPRFPEEAVRYWSVAGPDGSFVTGPAAFAESLVRTVRAGMAQRSVDGRGVPTFPAVMAAFLEERQQAMGAEDCRDCRSTYETRLAALQEQLESLRSENEYYADEAGKAEREAAILKQERFMLEDRVNALTEQLDAREASAGGEEVLPTRLDGIPEWAHARLGRRLLLLPRAVRELKGADFEDVGLVCSALRLLADDYHAMRLGRIRVADFTDRAMALGLTWGQSTDEAQAGRHGDAYYVTYPATGRGRRTFLDLHLRKGTSFEPRLCLRIYFFWGEEDQKVVVGSLPRHLPSSAD